MNDPELLHLYAGPSFHSDGFIVGNRKALERLRDALNEVLKSEDEQATATVKAFTSDGEGYDAIVIRQDSNWQNGIWNKLALPYTAEDGLTQVSDSDIWPEDLI